MRVLFLGGDRRQAFMIRDLYDRNYDIDLLGYNENDIKLKVNIKYLNTIEMDKYDVIIFPVSGVFDNGMIKSFDGINKIILPVDLLSKTKEDVLIFTGVMTRRLALMKEISNRNINVLMDDKEIQRENSIPTVEGIIGELIYNTVDTINGSNIVVLGYGNVGKLLTDTLRYLGAKVIVGINSKVDYDELKFRGIKAFYTDDIESKINAINSSDIVINTVPSLIIDDNCLSKINNDVYILDISSYPYGVDFDSANKRNVKNKLLLGIPSIVAPKTSALILTKKIKAIIKGDK